MRTDREGPQRHCTMAECRGGSLVVDLVHSGNAEGAEDADLSLRVLCVLCDCSVRACKKALNGTVPWPSSAAVARLWTSCIPETQRTQRTQRTQSCLSAFSAF